MQLAAAETMASICDPDLICDELEKDLYCGILAKFLPQLSVEKKNLVLDHFLKLCKMDATQQPRSFISFYQKYPALIK